jgi:hypothetical protein
MVSNHHTAGRNNKKKLNYIFTALRTSNVVEVAEVSKIYYHTKFQDLALHGTGVAPTAEVRTATVLLLVEG